MQQTDLIQQEREIMRRLSGLSLTEVKVDEAVVAQALDKFLAAIKLPALPVRWARDGLDACTILARAERVTAIDGVKSNPSTFREWFIRKDDTWMKKFDEAFAAGQGEVLRFVLEMIGNRAERRDVFDGYGNSLIFAARAAAECAWTRTYDENPENFRYNEVKEFEEDWFPFVDACEAGLWLFWITESEVVALSRPIVHLKDQLVHSETGPAAYWPEGEDEYFVINGVQVPRAVVVSPADEIDARLILTEKDPKVRRQIVGKIGLERVCRGLDAVCVDRQGDYELLMLDLQDDGAHPFLKMKDPSSGAYHVEGVAPECATVEAALAWRNQTDVPPSVLT